MRVLVLFLVLVTVVSCSQQRRTWSITDFGAKAGSPFVNTNAIQRAVDECANAGGGKVVVPLGEFVTGTILLKDHVELHLEEGAVLIGSTNPNDYVSIDSFIDATGQARGKCLIGAMDAKDVSLTGKGQVDGRGAMFTVKKVKETVEKLKLDETAGDLFERPFLIRLVRTKGIKIEGLKLKNPAAWTVHLYQCSNFYIDGISIHSHTNKNNDGIDIDSSSDGVIANCDIDSGDDAICFKTTSPIPTQNIQVSDCRLKSDWGTIKLGTESMGDFRNIRVESCLVHDTKGGGIKVLSVDGAVIDNVVIDNITMENVEMPVFVRLGERLRVYRDAEKQEVGSISNLTISNIKATVSPLDQCRITPPTGILITGTPNHKIGQVLLKNIEIILPGGGAAELQNKIVPENEIKYPEFTTFDGALPAYGMYARHIESLELDHVNFNLVADDKREKIVLDDALIK